MLAPPQLASPRRCATAVAAFGRAAISNAVSRIAGWMGQRTRLARDPEPTGLVSLLLPLADAADRRALAVASSLPAAGSELGLPEFELIVLVQRWTRGSTRALAMLHDDPRVRILDTDGVARADALAVGALAAAGDFVVTLAPDTRVEDVAALTRELRAMPDAAAIDDRASPCAVAAARVVRRWAARAVADVQLADRPAGARPASYVWGSDVRAVYGDRAGDDVATAMHFADDAAVRAALELLSPQVFRDAERARVVALSTGRGVRRPIALPEPWLPPGRGRRVLLQVDDFQQGGLEQVVLDLAVSLAARGFEPAILVLGRRGEAFATAEAQGLELRTLDARRGRLSAYEELVAGFDLVHAQHSTFGAARVAAQGKPFVQTIHNSYVWLGRRDLARYRAADRWTSAYVCVSASAAAYAQLRLGLGVERFVIIHNGIRSERLRNASDAESERARLRAEFAIGPDDFVFLNVASIYPPKAQRVLAHALAIAGAREPSLRVVVLGRAMDEAYAQALRADLRQLGITDRFRLAGHRDPVGFYRMADAFVLPSFWEGCSLAVAEALTAGLPAVLADVGAAASQLAHGEGLLVEPACADLTRIDRHNHLDLCRAVPPDYVERVADAMLELAARGPHRTAPRSPSPFDVRASVEHHAWLYRWLISGGLPAAARHLPVRPRPSVPAATGTAIHTPPRRPSRVAGL